MTEMQYQQLCEEVRSTDVVSFSLQKNQIILLALVVFAQILSQGKTPLAFNLMIEVLAMVITVVFYFSDLRNMQICYSAINQIISIEKQLKYTISIYSAPRSPKFLFFSLSKLWGIHIFYTASLCFYAGLPIALYVFPPTWINGYLSLAAFFLILLVACGMTFHSKLARK